MCTRLNTLTVQPARCYANTLSTWSLLTSSRSSSLTWQLGRASVRNVAKEEIITGAGIPGFKSSQMQRDWIPPWAISTPPYADAWTTAQPRLFLLCCVPSYPLLFLWINPLSPSLLSSPLCLPLPPLSGSGSHEHRIATADVHTAETEG